MEPTGLEADGSMTEALLRMTLQVAVPLCVPELRRLPFSEVMRIAEECANVVAHKGDVILYKSKKPGETSKAFAALARGVACLSFMPGGVHAFGDHYVNQHPEQGEQPLPPAPKSEPIPDTERAS